FAQQAPKPADAVMQEAFERAVQENKNVFVIFHASWCGWCRKMDTAMNDVSVKKFFEDNYVITHLTVLESDENKELENPGAEEMYYQYGGGDDQGIPYWLVFDKDGKLLADSQIRPEGAGLDEPGQNAGCPAKKEEVAHFIRVLKKTSSLNKDQLAIIQKRFRENKGGY
ncbi:MAG: thioredoxin family protein, partial [Flavisolibacter sp.]|nr:thioredoxin family protein [Flavisolibacter sp.]